MERAGQEKHPLAPVIYKILTGRLGSAGDNEYDVLLTGFTQLLDDLPSIPTTPVVEALSQRSDLKAEQLEMTLFGKMLASGTDARVAVGIYNLVSRTFVEETGFGRELTYLLIQILSTFKEE
jgi:hypothetical protein